MNAKKASTFLFALSAIFGIAGIALFFVEVIAADRALRSVGGFLLFPRIGSFNQS